MPPRLILRPSRARRKPRRRRLNPGVDQNGEDIRQPNCRTELVANPPDSSGLRKKTGKNVCSRARAEAHTRGSSIGNPASSARDRRAAAASAEPPPRPAAAGNRLISRKRPSLNLGIRSARDRASRKTRFLSRGPASSARGPRTSRLQVVAGLKCEPVTQASKRHQALEVVISVEPSPDHAQREIDLRRSACPPHRASRAPPQPPPCFSNKAFGVTVSVVTSGRPPSIFFKISGISSASAPMSRA